MKFGKVLQRINEVRKICGKKWKQIISKNKEKVNK